MLKNSVTMNKSIDLIPWLKGKHCFMVKYCGQHYFTENSRKITAITFTF